MSLITVEYRQEFVLLWEGRQPPKSRQGVRIWQIEMKRAKITLLLSGSAFTVFLGVFTAAVGAMAFRFGDRLGPIGFWMGCLELFVALTTIALVALSGKIRSKIQGLLLVGCSLLGICILSRIAYVKYVHVYSSDWALDGMLEITGFLFAALLILLLVAGIGTIGVTKKETS